MQKKIKEIPLEKAKAICHKYTGKKNGCWECPFHRNNDNSLMLCYWWLKKLLPEWYIEDIGNMLIDLPEYEEEEKKGET